MTPFFGSPFPTFFLSLHSRQFLFWPFDFFSFPLRFVNSPFGKSLGSLLTLIFQFLPPFPFQSLHLCFVLFSLPFPSFVKRNAGKPPLFFRLTLWWISLLCSTRQRFSFILFPFFFFCRNSFPFSFCFHQPHHRLHLFSGRAQCLSLYFPCLSPTLL